ncbi:hypothetical protein B0T16DRAFT_407646 [Cercophora newfieldiana]|uniref:Secreted protein n=1 Tax=Cercophora newfieldiana TaxID=92897 RepID=A0AA39Y988_9PEZI|nr:hypothetical protein B0T16DRAFT_407646 [Cercophora newfieldiana]
MRLILAGLAALAESLVPAQTERAFQVPPHAVHSDTPVRRRSPEKLLSHTIGARCHSRPPVPGPDGRRWHQAQGIQSALNHGAHANARHN